MRILPRTSALATSLVVAAALASCGDDSVLTGPEPSGATQLRSVVPAGGATDVDPTRTITVSFNHAIDPTMADLVELREGDVTGPAVDGIWSWSEDHTRLSFAPQNALRPGTTYVIHLGGGLRDGWGRSVDCQSYGVGLGGRWAWGPMWNGGGMMGDGPPIGPGWRHANGSYGMVFTFTTAG